MSLAQWDTGHRNEKRGETDAWSDFFATLPDGARILGIGNGHGMLARVAADTASATGRKWGFLAAGPLPADANGQLPFDAESFDAAGGHDALGQGRTGTVALVEAYRVLKPGGDAQFIVHAADSLQAADRSLREAAFVLGETAVFRRLHRLVTLQQAPAATVQEAMGDVRAAIHALKQGLPEGASPASGGVLGATLEQVQALLVASRQMSPDAIGREVDRAEDGLRDSVRALGERIAHACTGTDMDGFEQDAAAAGFVHIERAPLHATGPHPTGWQLLLHRP